MRRSVRFVDPRVSLVQTFAIARRSERRAAIADIMFGARQNAERIGERIGLQSQHGRSGEVAHNSGIFGIAFVGSAPARILRNRDARCEGPVDPGRARLFGGDLHDALHQRRVASATQPDVVREDYGAEHVAVPVHGIDAVEQRNAQARLQRVLLKVVVHVGPGFQAVPVVRIGIAAVQNGAEKQGLDVGWIFDVLFVGLRHLADFFVEGHAGQERVDLRVERRESHRSRRD